MKKKITAFIAVLLTVQLAFFGSNLLPAAYAEGPVGSGNMNVDIDISPDATTIQAGQTAVYNLAFKATGSTTEFTNAKIVIALPQAADFSQPLSELAIADTQPVYSSAAGTLTYSFPTLDTGQVYRTKVKVVPPNGTTTNDTKLTAQATFSADGIASATDSAQVTVTSGTTTSITKRYTSTEGKADDVPPVQNDIGIWAITVNVPKANVGQAFLEEGGSITVTDTIPAGTTYLGDDSGGVINGGTITWTLPAPTLATQQGATDSLFSKTINVRLQFNSNLPNFTTVSNTAGVVADTINGQTAPQTATATRQIADSSGTPPPATGGWIFPQHRVNGGTSTQPIYNWGTVDFSAGFAIRQSFVDTDDYTWTPEEILATGYQEVTLEYDIDPNLNVYNIDTFVPSYYPNDSASARPLPTMPTATIKAMMNGVWTNEVPIDLGQRNFGAQINIPLSSLGISPGQHVQALAITYRDASGGLNANPALWMDFRPNPSYTGAATNSIQEYGTFNGGKQFVVDIDPAGNMGLRSVTVQSDSAFTAIADNTVSFVNADGNAVGVGNNTVHGTFWNNGASQKYMHGTLDDVVLLPHGVTVDEANTGATFKNNASRTYAPENGSLEILDRDYAGTGRQLVKIVWTAPGMGPGQHVGFRFNVIVAEDAPSPLRIESYGFSSEAALTASGATNPELQVDSDDLNRNDNYTEPRIKTSSEYIMNQTAGLVTLKSVKGDLDSAYSRFGHASPGGTVTYNLNIVNLFTDTISNMTLIDVLPSVGDLGITDNVERGSTFTPTLTGPIEVPASWEGKVNVYYSTATNPKRVGDIDVNTDYPLSTTHLVDPAGAQDPNWMTEASVGNDWSSIHSFKIELAPGVSWLRGASVNLQFTVAAPTDLDPGMTDPNVDEQTRAAWNSFAFAANDSQVVEPGRVGFVVNTEDPTVDKTVDGEQNVTLANRDDTFHYAIDFNFNTSVYNWESATLVDDLTTLPAQGGVAVADVLEFVPGSVTVKDESGNSVLANGTLSADTERVEFAIDAQNGSYGFLKGHTYTLEVDARVKASATDAQLKAFADASGIPNVANLNFTTNGELQSTPSNPVDVTPPTPGGNNPGGGGNTPGGGGDNPGGNTPGGNNPSTPGKGAPKTGDQTMSLVVALVALAGTTSLAAFAASRRRRATNK